MEIPICIFLPPSFLFLFCAVSHDFDPIHPLIHYDRELKWKVNEPELEVKAFVKFQQNLCLPILSLTIPFFDGVYRRAREM